jgi:hypothetical protein
MNFSGSWKELWKLADCLIGAHFGRDDVVGGQRRAVMHRHDADLVGGILDHHRLEAVAPGDQGLHLVEQRAILVVEHQAVDAFARDDHELRGVDGIGALAQDRALGPLCPPLGNAHIQKSAVAALLASVCVGPSGAPSRAKT